MGRRHEELYVKADLLPALEVRGYLNILFQGRLKDTIPMWGALMGARCYRLLQEPIPLKVQAILLWFNASGARPIRDLLGMGCNEAH